MRWNPRIGVRQAQYTQTGTFTGTFEEAGNVSIPFYAINPSAIPPEAGGAHQPRRVSPALHGRRVERHQAHGRPLADRPRILDQQSHRVLRQPSDVDEDPTPVCDFTHVQQLAMAGDATAGGRRCVLRSIGRQRQKPNIRRPAEVPVHRQRAVPGAVGHQPRGRTSCAAGLCAAVLSEPGRHRRIR